MRKLVFAVLMVLATASGSLAADRSDPFRAEVSAKEARIETLRARAALSQSGSASTSLIEADDLLYRLRQAPPDKRSSLGAQLDALLSRVELEIEAAARQPR